MVRIAALLLAGLCVAAPPALADPLKIGFFPGGSNVPIWVAEAQGFFIRENLQIDLVPTAGSRAQMRDLLAGETQIALTAADNVLAYGATVDDPTSPRLSALEIILGIDPGFQNVVVAPAIEDFADLKNKIVAVDAPDTGYAFALFAILAKNHLQRGVDYELNAVGGGTHRWAALQAGSASAALMATPLELIAGTKGFHVLARMDQELGAYAGNVAAVRRGWAARHPSDAAGFSRAVRSALAYLHVPANRAATTELLIAHTPDLTPAIAEQSITRMLDPDSGFSKTGDLDVEGLRTVIALRANSGTAVQDVGDVERYLPK